MNDRGLRKTDVIAATGIADRTLTAYLSNERWISTPNAIALAHLLKCTPKELRADYEETRQRCRN